MKENTEQSSAKTERVEAFPLVNALGWVVEYTDKPEAPQIEIDAATRRVSVNRALVPDAVLAEQLGVLAVTRETALIESLRGTNPKETLKLFSEHPDFVHELLRLTGARILREREPRVAERMANRLPPAKNSAGEFRLACELYLATGAFPPTTEAVRAELETLPISPRTREHLLSALASERIALSRKRDYFDRFFAPALERLKKNDADARASSREDFKPSTDDLKRLEMQEGEIMQRVLPFVGGYFREKVMDGVDWENMRVAATGVPSERLVAPEEPRQPRPDAKIHTFFGTDGKKLAGGELTAALPANAWVLPETAADGLVIRMAENGTHTLEWSGRGAPPDQYTFQFERTDEIPAWRKREPTEAEQGIPSWALATLSEETRTFLEGLKKARVTDEARVEQIAWRAQTTIEYVNDTAVGAALSAAGKEYFAVLERDKKGDCDVSNFYALAHIRALGIPCRMVTGYHVTRDKRFPFAALAGIKHAWLEWWNKDQKLWVRADATPPKPPREKEDEDGGGGGGQDRDMRPSEGEEPAREPEESDDDPWGLPLFEDDLARLKKRLSEIQEGGGDAATLAGQIFEDLYGIPKERWEEVRRVAEEIGQEQVPAEATVDGRDSTVAEEWRRIFDLLRIAYRLPSISRPVMGRRSQGGELVDPVSAGVDVMTGAEDPYGYQRKKSRERVEQLPIRFSNDFLLDTTASMTAKNNQGVSLLELEKRFVLSSLYEGYKLNERVKQSAAWLRGVPVITNHILSIHGGGKWQEVVKNAPMSLKELAAVNEIMKKPVAGAGAMAEAIERYVETLEEDPAIVAALKQKEMVKTLTIITDGNLWCSACGKESCNYELHGPTLARVERALEKVRGLGVIVNAIGFTERSRPVAELFAKEDDPEATAVIENLAGALAAHHRQILRSMKPVIEAGRRSGKTAV